MKGRFTFVVLAILLLAAFCTTVVVAKPSEKSPVSQFEVVIDNLDGTSGTGKITVNTIEEWYVFNGKRLTPGETYSLFINGEVLNSGTADADGRLHLEGTCTTTVETVTVKIVTIKQSAFFDWSGMGYATRTSDGVVLYIFFDGTLIGPDGEPIPGATIDLYLEDKVTLLTDDAGNTRTMTTDANGRWQIGYTWDFYVTHYGWIWSGTGSEVTNHVFLHFAGNDQYSEAWSSPMEQ